MSIFDDARASITRSLIEQLFSASGAYWADAEYHTLNPSRPDKSIGSFHINSDGQYYDHATDEGGDIIDLLVARDGISKKQAAERIAGKSADNSTDKPPAKRADKKPAKRPILPVPAGAIEDLHARATGKYYTDKYGRVTSGWRYTDAEGRVLFATVRYQKSPKNKAVIPFHFSADGDCWRMGHAYESGRPLYNLPALVADTKLPVLVVEGEKCADVVVAGYVLTTWAGGGSHVSRADWAPLADRDVVVWPDADEPGIKAAAAIANRLTDVKILRIPDDKPDGWDIADAAGDGIDIPAFIAEHMPTVADLPFVCLGYDVAAYWFLGREQRLPYKIEKGRFTASKFLELASVSEWALMLPHAITDSGSLKVGAVQDYLRAECEQAGIFAADSLRGAGVWLDGGKIVANDGARLISADGKTQTYGEHSGAAHYIASEVGLGSLAGPESTDADGVKLLDLARLQRWSSDYMAVAAMGWALISPFGGLLAWRPHIWVSGRKGTGKSWVVENLLGPICGPFAFTDSGIGTEPGIRRALNMDARPVILDEMEPRNKASRERIARILDLARNSSSNASSTITMAAGDRGTVRYVVRSSFCCASVNIPDEGAAVASRFIRCELKRCYGDEERKKIAASRAMYAELMAGGAERFRVRIFRDLPKIRVDIEYLRDNMIADLGEQRAADLMAPVLAAAWAIQSRLPVSSPAGLSWLTTVLDGIMGADDGHVEDEDRVIHHLLGSHVRMDDSNTRTIAELLTQGGEYLSSESLSNQMLSRFGLKIYEYSNGDGGRHKALAISTRSDQIGRMLAGTPYEHGYDAQLKRHPLCANPEKATRVRMATGRVRCRLLEWDGFVEQYMGAGD